MTRDKVFLAAVQSGLGLLGSVYCRLLERGGMPDVYEIVVRAAQIPEEAIPMDVATAAREFVEYATRNVLSTRTPEWYLDWLDSWPADARPKW
jgi:hypothetical protein